MSVSINRKQMQLGLLGIIPDSIDVEDFTYTELFSPSDIGISYFEDFIVIHVDDYYYGFLTHLSSVDPITFAKIMYVKSDTPLFTNILDYGTALNIGNKRPKWVEYDPVNEKYYLLVDDRGNARNTSYECNKNSFPTGFANEVVVLDKGAGGQWDENCAMGAAIYHPSPELVYLLYMGHNNTFPRKVGMAYGKNLRQTLTKSPNNPIYTPQDTNMARLGVWGALSFGYNHLLVACESWNEAQTDYWRVPFLNVFLSHNDAFITEHPDAVMDDDLGLTDEAVANAYWLIDADQYAKNEFILYVNATTEGNHKFDRLFALKYIAKSKWFLK